MKKEKIPTPIHCFFLVFRNRLLKILYSRFRFRLCTFSNTQPVFDIRIFFFFFRSTTARAEKPLKTRLETRIDQEIDTDFGTYEILLLLFLLLFFIVVRYKRLESGVTMILQTPVTAGMFYKYIEFSCARIIIILLNSVRRVFFGSGTTRV